MTAIEDDDPRRDPERERRVDDVLADAVLDLGAWLLADKLGESDETIDRLGVVTYDRLSAALGIDPDGDAAFAIVTAVLDTGRPHSLATRMWHEFSDFMASGATR